MLGLRRDPMYQPSEPCITGLCGVMSIIVPTMYQPSEPCITALPAPSPGPSPGPCPSCSSSPNLSIEAQQALLSVLGQGQS